MGRFGIRMVGLLGPVAALLISGVATASAMNVSSTGEGGCSLRAAIQAVAANDGTTSCGSVVSGGATPINLPANTYTPFDGQILVPAGTNIEINGENVNNPLTTVIDGAGGTVGRIFEIASGATVKLSGLTVTGGQALSGGAATSLYGSYSGDNGGAILNKGSLTLDHVVVEENRAGDGGNGWNGGLEESGGAAGWGGNGGGIYNADHASLTISDSVLTDNVAGEGGDGGDGGAGVNALGHNPSGRDGGNGGPGGSGGGIYNSNFGSLTIDRTTINHNFSGRGGSGGAGHQGAGGNGTFTSGGNGGWGGNGGDNGKAYCRGCSNTFTDQTLGGGGIYNLGSSTITNSTVSSNGTGAGGNGGPSGPGGQNNESNTFRTSGTAGFGGGGGRGGGLLNGSWHQGAMTLINVTVTGNLTGDGGTGGGGPLGESSLGGGPGGFSGDGGGIWAQGSHDNITSITHLTITRNFVGSRGLGGGGQSAGTPGGRGIGAGIAAGGRYNPGGSAIYLKNSLVASNGLSAQGDKNCIQYQNIESYQEFADQGNNLTYPNDGGLCFGLTNVDPDLNLLGDYGGPTETMVPQPGSAAIGGVPLAACTVPNDQRGVPRPGSNGSCDIGAVETDGSITATPTTTQVVSSLNPAKVGQSVTLTATVSPPPSSGTVSFSDGGSVLSGCESAPLKAGGQFTCSATFSSVGSHSITASYTGNTLFGASTSPVMNQTVNGAQPTPRASISRVAVTGPASTKKGGRPSFSVRVSNGGNATATGVSLKVTGGDASVSKPIGVIQAGGAKVVKVAIKLSKPGRKKLAFRVTSANAGSKATTKVITVRAPTRRHR